MTLSARTLLSPEARARLAADPGLGGGNVLRRALAAAPEPDQPFLLSTRPVATCDGGSRTEFSLRGLDDLVQSWSVWYLGRGVAPRDRVALYLEDSVAYSVHSHALAQIGAIPVLVNSRAPYATALELVRRTRPAGLYTTRTRMAALAGDLAAAGVRWSEVAEELPAPAAARLPDDARFRHDPGDPVVVLHSSGTTGSPKPVVHTHASSVAGPRFRLTSYTESPGELMMAAQPQSHLGSVLYLSYAVLAGTPIIAHCDTGGVELAEAIREHRPTTVMAFAHAFAELAEAEVAPGAVDSVRSWVTMGDAIHDAHVKGVLDKRGAHLPPAAFYDRFGSTELGWGLMVHTRSADSGRDERCVGRPDAVAEVAVLRPDGTPAEVGEVGLFGAKGPTITVGYWNDSDATYRSRLAGYWLSGDLAYRGADGAFYQLDRAVDAIDTTDGTGGPDGTGGTVHSVDIEEFLLNEVPALSDCAVVAGRHDEETVLVAVVTSADGQADPAALLGAANAALGGAGRTPLTVLELARSEEDFPQGVTGKVLKRQLRERYADLGAYLAAGDPASIASVLPAG